VDRRLARENIGAGLWLGALALFVFGLTFVVAIAYTG
jgi:hypothetical protein